MKIIRGTAEEPIVVRTDIKRLFKKNDLSQLVSVKNGDVIFVASTTLAKIDSFSQRISEFLDILERPAIYRDLYTTGGIGRADTGNPITGLDDSSGNKLSKPTNNSYRLDYKRAKQEINNVYCQISMIAVAAYLIV